MIYENLIIQQNVWPKLKDYYIKEKIPNAFLFHGQDGSGKEGHAIELAALINCLDTSNMESCGKCLSCKKIKILQHGNLKLVHPLPRGKINSSTESPFKSLTKSELEHYRNMLLLKSKNPYSKVQFSKSNSILINSIRSLKKDLLLSPIEHGWNIVVISEAEKLCYSNNVSANALLKILEEPPEKTLFILITSNYSKIIDTLKSRCQNIFFPPIPINELYNIIDDSISDVDKYVIANISNGNMELINNLEKSIDELYNNLKLFINCCYRSDCKYDKEIIDKVYSLKRSENTTELLLFFRTIIIYFKDLLTFAKSKDIEYIIYKNLDKHYHKITDYHKKTNWISCIDIIENTLNNIYRNASIPLSVNGMLIEIREIIVDNSSKVFNINNWLEIE